MNLPTEERPVSVLLVEDDPGDVDLTKEALAATHLDVDLSVVVDGQEAMQYLRREGQYINAAKPDLVLLDLNMPRKDGREVLHDIKKDPDLTTIPVVVLTTSDADEDVHRAYDLGANCYVTKPAGFEQYAHVVKSVGNFWFVVVKLPGR